MHDCSLLPCCVFSGCMLVLKSTTAMLILKCTTALCYLGIFRLQAGPQIHDSHAAYFPVASWSSNARLLFATMLGIFRLQAGPQIHDSHTEYFPVASWSSNARLLFATMLGIFRLHAGPQIHDSHADPQMHDCSVLCTTALCYHAVYFLVACWSSNPRQPC